MNTIDGTKTLLMNLVHCTCSSKFLFVCFCLFQFQMCAEAFYFFLVHVVNQNIGTGKSQSF